jgi:Asp-tRNA(Asn)/Glu-tRNA(Gln) amidotransferase A subunit family amidase
LGKDQLPIGIQLLADDYQEGMLFRVAQAFEEATLDEAWRKVKPKVLRD